MRMFLLKYCQCSKVFISFSPNRYFEFQTLRRQQIRPWPRPPQKTHQSEPCNLLRGVIWCQPRQNSGTSSNSEFTITLRKASRWYTTQNHKKLIDLMLLSNDLNMNYIKTKDFNMVPYSTTTDENNSLVDHFLWAAWSISTEAHTHTDAHILLHLVV